LHAAALARGPAAVVRGRLGAGAGGVGRHDVAGGGTRGAGVAVLGRTGVGRRFGAAELKQAGTMREAQDPLAELVELVEPAAPAPRRSRQAMVRWGSSTVSIGGDAPV